MIHFPPSFSLSYARPFGKSPHSPHLTLCFYLRFHLTPSPHLSFKQPKFQFILNSCVSLSSMFPAISHPSSLHISCWHDPERHRKGGQLCHHIGSHFIGFHGARLMVWGFSGSSESSCKEMNTQRAEWGQVESKT